MAKKAATYDPYAFTAEVDGSGAVPSSLVKSATVPDTVQFVRPPEKKKASPKKDSLVRAMEDVSLTTRKSGVETSMLAVIAEGDENDVSTYTSLAVDGKGKPCKPKLTPEVVKTLHMKSQASIRAAVDQMALAQRVCLVFVCDTTGSMAPHMQGIKGQIIAIVQAVRSTGCQVSGLGFIGYKDWCDGNDQIQTFPIINADAAGLQRFQTFVQGIVPTGGGDYPEDVLGGLDAAIRLSWPDNCGTRVVFHIGDAPPHGNPKYHDNPSDDYPRGHARDRPLSELFSDFKAKNVQYYFGRINNGTDKMLKVFEATYGAPIGAFETCDPSAITASVTESVSRSVSVSCSASVSSLKTKGLCKRPFTLCPTPPSWDTLPMLSGTLVSNELPESVDAITNFDALKQVIKSCRVKIAPQPFAHGSVRLVYYGQMFYNAGDGSASAETLTVDDYVLKEMLTIAKVPELDRMRYLVDLEVQTVAAAIAFWFNDRLGSIRGAPDWKLKFLMAKVLRVPNEDGTHRYLAAEKMYRGPRPKMVRFTNNLAYVADCVDEQGRTCLAMAVAFSHFSYDHTNGYLLVCDLQGLPVVKPKGKSTLLLTDPAIHCPKHTRFGKTNLQLAGIKAFFKQHKCNDLCRGLGLSAPSL